jgi:two-component system OmpR family sensor kinase
MRGLRSIRWQLQAWHGVLLAAILGGLGVTAYYFERAHQLERLDQELQSLAARLANATRPSRGRGEPPVPGRSKQVRLSPEDAALFAPGGGFYFAVWLKNGVPYTASEAAPGEIPRPPEDESGLRTRAGLREAFLSPAPGDIFLVGTSAQAIEARLRRLAGILFAFGVGIFGVAMVIGAWFVGRSLRPIGEISAAAARIAEGDLSRRINTTETGSELNALAQTLNSTFAQLETAFARQARFTADAAHELRTPVTVLLTHVQNVINGGDLSADNREALEACQRAAQRMRRLIESLLQLARFDAGSEALERRECDLAVVARECADLTRPLADARGLAFGEDLRAAPFSGDPDRIAQVLVNLLGNAIQYNHEGGEVRLATRCEGREAVCEVANSGPGIEAAHLPHVFERFYRVDQARTGGSGRTGLGLAISKAVIMAHGGTISVESEVGGRTVFTFRLPAREGGMQPSFTPPSDPQIRSRGGARAGSVLGRDAFSARSPFPDPGG